MDAIENKAKELVDKFIRYTPAEKEYEYDYAKRCAVICCEEVIKILESVEANINFWQSVIKKIKNL